jgi:hypothetical protein
MLIPGMTDRLPAVYGPISYPVKKIGEDNYYIKGYSNYEFKGSLKKIAQEILWQLVHRPEQKPRLHYVGPFSINFWPEMRCGLCMDPDPDPPDLDCRAISEELTKELRPFITVTVDKNIITPHITMATSPFNSTALPSCDPPLAYNVTKDGILVLKTDNCGLEFEIIGDKHVAAIAFLEYSINHINSYGYMFDKERRDFTHRMGAIDFKVVDRRVQDVEPHFKEAIPYVTHTPEDREEVLETIKIIKSALRMKAFL